MCIYLHLAKSLRTALRLVSPLLASGALDTTRMRGLIMQSGIGS